MISSDRSKADFAIEEITVSGWMTRSYRKLRKTVSLDLVDLPNAHPCNGKKAEAHHLSYNSHLEFKATALKKAKKLNHKLLIQNNMSVSVVR